MAITANDVALNLKRLKADLATLSEMPEEQIDDRAIKNLGDTLQGAAPVIDSGRDPASVPAAELKAQANPEPMTVEEEGKNQNLYRALIGLLPTIAGAAIGGNEGGAIGAKAGATGIATYNADLEKARKERLEREKDARKITLERAKEERKNQFQLERDKKRAELRAQNTRTKREEDEEFKRDRRRAQSKVPGFELVEGFDPVEKDVRAVRTSLATEKRLSGLINKLQSEYEKHGTEVIPGPAKDRMQLLRRDIQLEMKELLNLGVLNGPDLDLLNEMVPDPTSYTSKALDSASLRTISGQLQLLRENIGDKVDATAEVFGFSRARGGGGSRDKQQTGGGAPQPPQAPPKRVRQGGVLYELNPQTGEYEAVDG